MLCLRIKKEIASQIYGTLNVPILNHKDPVTAKFVFRGVHNLTKSTLANVVKGEAVVFLKGQQKQIKEVIQ